MNELEFNFPVEIIEQILIHLDGSSIVKASAVNKFWRAAYLNLLGHNIFETRCRNEMSPEDVLSIVERLYPTYPIKRVGKIDWFRVYKCWYLWKNINNWTPSTETIVEEYCNHITCIRLSGDCLIYGTHAEGKVEVYNMKTKVKYPLYRGLGVKDIDLYNYLENLDGGNNCVGSFNDTEYFHHEAIRLFVKNENIFSLPLHEFAIKVMPVPINDVMNFGSSSNLLWLISVRNNYNKKLNSLGYRTKESSSLQLTIHNRFFVSVDRLGDVQFDNLNGEITVTKSETRFRGYEDIVKWTQLSVSVSFGIAFHQFHMIFFVVENKVKPYIPRPNMFTIGAALLHCNMLFLGNSKGVMYVYKLTNEDSLLSLSLFKCSWKYKVCNDFIIGLDIQYNEENIPYIVVATETSVYKVFFNDMK